MPVFVVVVRQGNEKVRERIQALPDETVYELTDDAWLVDYDDTTRAVAEKLGVRGDPSKVVGSGIVFPISNYAGRFPTGVWEWLAIHQKERG